MGEWKRIYRPGYFGRKRDLIIAALNETYCAGNWKLVWHARDFIDSEFHAACILFYEYSYFNWFVERTNEVDFVCSHGEVIDNAMTNISSGRDYTKQEAFSTHIQDIAVRNVIFQLGRKFEGPKDRILTIRTSNSNGAKYGPGNIPFFDPSLIESPSLAPRWSKRGSVEDFWQSNKYISVKGTPRKAIPLGFITTGVSE